VKADRDTFGPRLRQERERRGIALKHIAASTKLKESLFDQLERNDFSHWPEGIFRRAHLCAYAEAIGLPPQPVLAEYLRLFSEDRHVDPPADLHGQAAAPVHQAKTSTSLQPGRTAPPWADRAWVVAFDLAAVCLIASVVAGLAGGHLGPFWPTLALVGLVYTALGSACFGQSIGTRLQRRIHALVQARRRPQAMVKAPRPEVQPIAFRQPRPSVPQSPGVSQVTIAAKADVEDRRASA
jgi:transcriptional regulator with XRE-family HTH domain